MYVCLSALKEGYKGCQRELFGLDGAFMRGPFPGQLLTAVGIDSNNVIYPLAYAVAEAESKDSWIWFLECIGDDLDLQPNSNYTFISDMQKGIIPALAAVFHSAEHIYCLKHIHDNMKLQWNAKAYKDHLWRCAAATTVQQFEAAMLAFNSFSEPAHAWLSKIPPTHWSRSHFSGRAHSDVLLNNMCEVFNGKLLGGRLQPIIIALECIREYYMKRIVNVVNVIDKCAGPLTPKATLMLDLIKKEAYKYTVLRVEGDNYQVSGWGDKCFVNVEARASTCRTWELTGMPCKHAVATHRYMSFNGMQVGSVESWVHPCYLLKTWEETYKHYIQPINGYQHWNKSQVPTSILPPKHHKPLGRPRKKRTRAFTENDDSDKTSNLSPSSRSIVCGICGNAGHNKKTCLGQGGVTGSPGSTQQSQKTGSSQPKVTAKKKAKVTGHNFKANEKPQCQTDAQSQGDFQPSVVQSQSGSQVDAASGGSPKQFWTKTKIIAAKLSSPQKNVG